MKGKIVDRAKGFALGLDEHVETAWKVLDDGFTVEIVWEALHHIELYYVLRIIEHVLLLAEYMFIETRADPLYQIKQESVQLKNITGGLIEEGKRWTWQAFKLYYISGAGINVCEKLTMDSTKNAGLYGNSILRPDHTSIHPRIPYVTEYLTSSYCC
jgi:hypothetical protein